MAGMLHVNISAIWKYQEYHRLQLALFTFGYHKVHLKRMY